MTWSATAMLGVVGGGIASMGVRGSYEILTQGLRLSTSSKMSFFKAWGSLRSLLMRRNRWTIEGDVECFKYLWSLDTELGWRLEG